MGTSMSMYFWNTCSLASLRVGTGEVILQNLSCCETGNQQRLDFERK